MDDQNSVSTLALALIAVAGGVGTVFGALLALLNGWLVERRAERREQQQWLRQRRYEAYTDLFAVAHAIETVNDDDTEKVKELEVRFNTSIERAHLVSDYHCSRYIALFNQEIGENLDVSDEEQNDARAQAINDLRVRLNPYMLDPKMRPMAPEDEFFVANARLLTELSNETLKSRDS